jgi:transcriptional regulator of acetoin/glycerol metabolism
MLGEGDFDVLAGYAREAETTARSLDREVMVGPTSVMHVAARPIESGSETMGSVLRLRLAKAPPDSAGAGTIARRTDPFGVIVGESVGLRRALQVASTAVRRRLPAYIVGPPGTGKSALAEAMAAVMADEVRVRDAANAQLDVEDDLAPGIDAGAAVVVKHVDHLDDCSRKALTESLARQENPLAIFTMLDVADEHTDLIAALGGVEIELPPLRSRREDIPLLVDHFLASAAHGVLRISTTLQRALTTADWAGGNVAQLQEFVNTAAARCDAVELAMQHLSESQRRELAPTALSRLEDAELRQIREALAEVDGNRVRAADLLQIGRSTLYRKIEMYQRRGFVIEG